MRKLYLLLGAVALLVLLVGSMVYAAGETGDPVTGPCYKMIAAPNVESLTGEIISVDTLAYCEEKMDTTYVFSQLSQRIRPGENIVLNSKKPFRASFNGVDYQATMLVEGGSYTATVLTSLSSVSNIKVAACGAILPSYGVLIVYPNCVR